MAEKIVVCCRMPPEGIRGALSATYLARARALTQRAEALGATLSAWSALTLAFAFDTDGLEEAVDLATALSSGALGADDVNTWASGIAQGDLEPLAETGQRADLAWGVPLVQALALSRMAKVGEVLLHTSLVAATDGTLNTVGAHDDHDVGYETRGLRLDCASPWARRPSAHGAPPRKPPPLPPRAKSSGTMRAALPVAPPAPPPAAPPVPSTQAAPAPSAQPAPPASGAGSPPPPLVKASARTTGPIPAALVTEPRTRSLSSIPPARYPSPSTFDAEEVDPEALAARMMQLSRDALLVGDAQSLERWSEGLKATGEKDEFAERMRAIARLSRGRVGDALRALSVARREAEEAPAAKRCQASLALAVGLAFASHHDEALLEALDALARAREGGDKQAESACLAFLAKLYRSVGRGEEAAMLGAKSMPPPAMP